MFKNFFIAVNSDNDFKYVAIPSIDNPRLIVSLYNNQLYKTGLMFHNTASIKNQIIKQGLQHLYLFYSNNKKNICTYNFQIEELLETLEKRSNKKLFISSFYIGTTNNKNQKITIQICDEDFKPVGIVKLPLSSESYAYIENEYNILIKNVDVQFENLLIPRNVFWINSNSITALYEEDILSKFNGIPLELSQEITNINLELLKVEIKKELNSYFSELFNKINEIKLPEEIIKLYENSKNIIINNKIPVVFIHGDFVKYNMKRYKEKIALIDWEFAREGLPLFDLFHFIFQGYTQIKKYKISKVVKKFFTNNNVKQYLKYLSALNISPELIKPLFILYLIDSIVFEKILKPWLKLNESNYYKALNFFTNNYID